MSRVFVIAASCLALSLTVACSKKAADTPAPASQPAPAAAPASQPAAAAQPAPAAEQKPIEITDDLVAKYMEYEKANIALVQQFAEETRKNLESAKGDTVKTLNQISVNDKLSKDLDEKLKAKRQSLGLRDDEFEVVKDGAQSIAGARSLYNQMGGDVALARMEAENKARIEKLPADQRPAAEAEVANLTKSLRDVRDGVDLRKRFGDKSTEVLLRHADELAKQYWDGLKLMAGKK